MKKFVKIISSSIIANLIPIIVFASEVEEGAHGGGHEGGEHLPDVISFFTHEGFLNTAKPVIFAFLVAILFCIAALKVYKKRQLIPGPFQNFMEILIEGMYNFIESVLGDHARRYIPFLGTLFFYILVMNFMGLIPGGMAPTTSFTITSSLAFLVFLYSQYTGFKYLGAKKYFLHLIGDPKDVAGWIITPIMLIIHLVGEVAKPASLALRLFGNINGEDILVAAFVGLGLSALAFLSSPVGLPLNVPFILLGILLSTIQALVFALLSTVYILMMLPHEEH